MTDDLQALRARGVDVLVCLLESPEQAELGLTDEALLCGEHRIKYVPAPVPDLGVPPNAGTFLEVVAAVVADLRSGLSVAVHCRQSVGRSGLFAVAVVIATGRALPEGRSTVSAARGVEVPETSEQLAWLRHYEQQLASLAG